mmetsp:Transcript_135295/g.432530  ORF Transcript_135295/g.432530 Transcript_135295/m.432530 type:complete len:200 (+) Transcript_135295:432-1031(+)
MNQVALLRPKPSALMRNCGYGDCSATHQRRHLLELCHQVPRHTEFLKVRVCCREEHLEYRPCGHGTAGSVGCRTGPSVEQTPKHCPCEHGIRITAKPQTLGSNILDAKVGDARPQATRGQVDAGTEGFVFEHALLRRSAKRCRCCRLVGSTDSHMDQFFQARREGFGDKLLDVILQGRVKLAADLEEWLVSGMAPKPTA